MPWDPYAAPCEFPPDLKPAPDPVGAAVASHLLDAFRQASVDVELHWDDAPEGSGIPERYGFLYRELLDRLARPPRFGCRVAVPGYLGEEYGSPCSGVSIGRCACGTEVRSDWDYCPHCGALLRWSCLTPA